MEEFIQDFLQTLQGYLPGALGAIGILIGGWFVALIGSAVARGLLKRTRIDNRIAAFIRGEDASEDGEFEVERWFGRAIYYLIMLFVVVGFLQALNLGVVAEPINIFLNQLLAYLPQVLGAVILLAVAWLLATGLKLLVVRVLSATNLDTRLTDQADIETEDRTSISTTLGNVVYWLTYLLFLPAVIGALGLEGLLEPVQGMVNEILGYVPNLLGAGVILVVGWLVARIVRQILMNTLISIGTDRIGERAGLESALGGLELSSVISTIVYVLILIPVVIAGLNALQIEAISVPATEMLTQVLNAVPAIFGALLLIGIAYYVARMAGAFVTNVLTGIGFDQVLSWIGIGEDIPEGRRSPSEIVGYLVIVGIMIFSVIMAANMLGFTMLAGLISNFLVSASGVLLAVIIFGLGLYFASLTDRVIRDTGAAQAGLLAPTARVAVIVFSGALALRQTGIAEDIVNLAFGLIVGSIAVATALAFGLGARDIAGRELERWLSSLRAPAEGGQD